MERFTEENSQDLIDFAYRNGVKHMLLEYNKTKKPGYISLYEGWTGDMANIAVDLFPNAILKLFKINFPKSKFYNFESHDRAEGCELVGRNFESNSELYFNLYPDDINNTLMNSILIENYQRKIEKENSIIRTAYEKIVKYEKEIERLTLVNK